MADIETELKLLFPTVAKYLDDKRFIGIFKCNGNENNIVTFNVPNYPNAKGITFEASFRFSEEAVRSLRYRAESVNFLEFLKIFKHTILNAPKQPFFNRTSFARFYDEYRQLRHQFPSEQFLFDPDNETLTVIKTDHYSVRNEIVVKLDFYEDDSRIFDIIKCSFPERNIAKLFHKQPSLLTIHKLFLHYIRILAEFHDTMQRIDTICWVIAPPNPTCEHIFRTIIIDDNNTSMKITFDPWNMLMFPAFKFFGTSEIVDKHRETASENLSNWDHDYDILQNMLNLLDLPFFPIKPEKIENKSNEIVLYEQETECMICFSYHLNEETPDTVCNFKSCRRQFHSECLYKWLSGLPNNSVNFNYICGSCPNCEQLISCEVPEL